MRSIFRSGLVLVTLSLVASCSDDGGPGGPSGEFQAWMGGDGADWADYLTTNAVELIVGEEEPLDAPSFAARSTGRHAPRHPASARPRLTRATLASTLQAAADEGCTITATGTDDGIWGPYDGNKNGVPDDYHLKLECFTVTDSATNSTYLQREEYRLKERVGEDYGFDVTTSALDRWEIDGALDEERESGRTMRVSRTGHRGTADWTDTYRFAEGGESPNGQRDREDVHAAFDIEDDDYVGDIPNGLLRLTARIEYVESDNDGFVFEVSTPIPLQVDSFCEWDSGQMFTGGVLLGSFHGDAERGFGLAYGHCGEGAEFYVFGQVEEEGPPVTRRFVR